MRRICAIYKVTNPVGEIYIGQSKNLKARWKQYRKRCVKNTKLIYQSILKYGIKSHSFEIIHELPLDVERDIMDEYESLYMDLYKSAGVVLLNMKGGGKNGKMSEETRAQMSKTRMGIKLSDETRRKMSEVRKGKTQSPESIAKRVAKVTGRIASAETRLKMSQNSRWRKKQCQ